jgi:hypothetical protein
MAEQFNYTGGFSTVGTIISTGANIYASMQKGKIKAIQNQMKAKELEHQSQMAAIDKQSKLDQLDVQYEQQIAAMTEQLSEAGESQVMQAMMQGRSMDSLASTQQADIDKFQSDKAMQALQKDYQEGKINADFDLQQSMTQADIGALNRGAEIAKETGKINAMTAATTGLQNLAKQGAFNSGTYWDKTDEAGSTGGVLDATTPKPKTKRYKN